jgi:hypothetical protein
MINSEKEIFTGGQLNRSSAQNYATLKAKGVWASYESQHPN